MFFVHQAGSTSALKFSLFAELYPWLDLGSVKSIHGWQNYQKLLMTRGRFSLKIPIWTHLSNSTSSQKRMHTNKQRLLTWGDPVNESFKSTRWPELHCPTEHGLPQQRTQCIGLNVGLFLIFLKKGDHSFWGCFFWLGTCWKLRHGNEFLNISDFWPSGESSVWSLQGCTTGWIGEADSSWEPASWIEDLICLLLNKWSNI